MKFVSSLKEIIADKSLSIHSVTIKTCASPDGAFDANTDLSKRRGEFLKEYLKTELGLMDVYFTLDATGENWELFYDIISKTNVPDKEQILDILESHREYVFGERNSVIGGPKKELMDLNGGRTWFWLVDNIFPLVRYDGNYIVCHFSRADYTSPDPFSIIDMPADTVVAEPIVAEPVFAPVAADTVIAEVPVVPAIPSVPETPAVSAVSQRAECRIGTNILYDACTVANISLEIGFARHAALNLFSTFSHWDIKPDLKFRNLLLQPELRYYFGNNFKGQYLGLEGHYGWYNVAPGGKERYQDKDGNTPLWGAGLSYGCVVPFSRHWGMDFGLSAGYAHLVYDCFYNMDNGAKFTTLTKNWWGPTRVNISIYYQF